LDCVIHRRPQSCSQRLSCNANRLEYTASPPIRLPTIPRRVNDRPTPSRKAAMHMYSQQLNGLHPATDVIMQKHNSQIIPADYIHCGNSYWYKIGATSQMTRRRENGRVGSIRPRFILSTNLQVAGKDTKERYRTDVQFLEPPGKAFLTQLRGPE
jgi:hypothetical protein